MKDKLKHAGAAIAHYASWAWRNRWMRRIIIVAVASSAGYTIAPEKVELLLNITEPTAQEETVH